MKGHGFMNEAGLTRALCLAAALVGVAAGSTVDSPTAADLIAAGDSFDIPHGPLQFVAGTERGAAGDLVAARRPRLARGPTLDTLPAGLGVFVGTLAARDVEPASRLLVETSSSRAPPDR